MKTIQFSVESSNEEFVISNLNDLGFENKDKKMIC